MHVRILAQHWPAPSREVQKQQWRPWRQLGVELFSSRSSPSLSPCTLRARRLRRGEKWRKRGIWHHGML